MTDPKSAAQDRLRDLRYCLDVLRPEAERLEVEQWDCIGIPWRFRRWWRAHRAHKAINAHWRAILEGQDHAPAASISRQVSWCNHGEADRGSALAEIDRIASEALRG